LSRDTGDAGVRPANKGRGHQKYPPWTRWKAGRLDVLAGRLEDVLGRLAAGVEPPAAAGRRG
jgi:hypothetical protein